MLYINQYILKMYHIKLLSKWTKQFQSINRFPNFPTFDMPLLTRHSVKRLQLISPTLHAHHVARNLIDEIKFKGQINTEYIRFELGFGWE